MKNLFIVAAFSTATFLACNNAKNESEPEGHNTSSVKDSSGAASVANNKDIKAVAITYTNVDVKAAASIKEIVDHYLHIKDALANDNAGEAAKGAKAMHDAISKMDKSLLTAEQKTAYDAIEEELKEHAEHIAKNGDNIKHQRSHFVMMSEVVYDLVKNFGAGRPVYHDHCPMARDNQGAMWLSEVKEINNPYFGAEMPKCGTVEEVIK